jgi:hypothetical protein
MKFSRGSKVPNITEPNGLQFCSRIEARQTVVRSPSKLSARKNRRPQPACPRCCRGPGAAPAWIRWLATGSSTSPPSTLSSTSPPSSRSIHPMPMPRFHAIPSRFHAIPSIHPSILAGLRALGNCARQPSFKHPSLSFVTWTVLIAEAMECVL